MKEVPPAEDKPHPKVLDVLYDAASEEDKLRNIGARPERIKETAHKRMHIRLARLAAEKIDIAPAFPPELVSDEPSEPQLTDREWEKVDHYQDTMGIGAAEAIGRVVSERRT